ncbi:ABC transporter substrate-binding protein [Nocardia sp. NPDC047038]|uniref:ABC transporter substrate-binding protein n=1 Tax=Nocardia sp. NPDC047038 TaxID=3154338 RepID=UPI0033DA0D31
MQPIAQLTTFNPTRRSFLGMLGIAGMAVAASPVITACSNDGGGSSSGRYRIVQPSKDPLVVWAVSYLAEDEGYYKDEGLEVERVLLLGGPAALTGLLSGAGDALSATPGETISAFAKGQDLKIVMGHSNNMPSSLVISATAADRAGVTGSSPLDERRTALARIGNLRLGITAPGSQTDAYSRMALRQAGIDAGAPKIVPLQTASNCLAALGNGDIDGYVGVPPAGETAMAASGAVLLLTAQAGEIAKADELQGMTLVVRGVDLEKRRDTYAAATRAEVKAMRALNDDFAAAGKLLRRTRFGSLDAVVWDYAWSRLRPSFQSPIVTEHALSAWVRNGLIDGGKVGEGDVVYNDLIDMRLTNDAMREVGFVTTR